MRTVYGRYAGSGVAHDDYSEESGVCVRQRSTDWGVRLPSDEFIEDEDKLAELSGDVVTYYVEREG